MTEYAAQRDMMQLPPELFNAGKRQQQAQTPHELGCVCGLLIDLQRVILGESTTMGLV